MVGTASPSLGKRNAVAGSGTKFRILAETYLIASQTRAQRKWMGRFAEAEKLTATYGTVDGWPETA